MCFQKVQNQKTIKCVHGCKQREEPDRCSLPNWKTKLSNDLKTHFM